MAARDWSRGKIRFALEQKGITEMLQVDRQNGLPLGTVSTTIRHPHQVGEMIVAAVLGIPAHSIWLSRYDAAGQRLMPQPMTAYRRPRAAGHGQKAKAA